MSNTTSGPQRHQKHAQRLDWLRSHPELLAELPGVDATPLTRAQADALDRALRKMTLLKYYAPTTTAKMTRQSIRQLVQEIRNESAEARVI